MRGPLPKPAAQRRRRNANPGAGSLPAEGRRGLAPALSGDVYTAATRRWWQLVWASPMATVWLDADRPGLMRLAWLIAEMERQPTAQLAELIYRTEDRYGLSPASRRRLQWEVAQAASRDEQASPPTRVSPTEGDPRLSIVPDAASS